MADTATGEMPSGAIRRAYQQQCLTDTDRHDRTLAPWADQPPPDTDDREGEAESGPPGEIEKENKTGSNHGRSWHDIALIIISRTFAGHEHAGSPFPLAVMIVGAADQIGEGKQDGF